MTFELQNVSYKLKSLEEAISKAVETGTIIETDDWKGYNRFLRLAMKAPVTRPAAVRLSD